MFIALNVARYLLAISSFLFLFFLGVDGFAREPLAVYCFSRDALGLCLY